jgi:hypothetical protein
VVRDRKMVLNEEQYFDWPAYAADGRIDASAVQSDLAQAERGMAKQGRTMQVSWRRLQEYGQDPVTVLSQFLTVLETAEREHEVLVAHNGWQFDVEFLQSAIFAWVLQSTGEQFEVDANMLYDTGVAEKASQLDASYEPFPLRDETLKQFFWRIGQARAKGVYWSMDKHCDAEYGLLAANGLKVSDLCRPAVDSFLVHRLFEEQRKRTGTA